MSVAQAVDPGQGCHYDYGVSNFASTTHQLSKPNILLYHE
jgi:hypothetical protein